jgi:hypothetical protein
MARRPSRRELELRRIADGLALELGTYSECWVAIKNGHVVASHQTPSGVLAILAAHDVRGAVLDYVPKPGTVYVLPNAIGAASGAHAF